MISGHEFIEKAREHIGLPYKWGGDFDGSADLVTIENVDKWAEADPVHFGYQKQQWLKTLFLGKLGGDCSGLLTHCLGLPKMYSGDIFGACEDKTAFDPSKPLNEQVPQVEGLIVWREGHIGVFCGDGYVIESGSTRYGVSATFINEPQTQKPWTNYGWLRKYVSYEEAPKEVSAQEPEPCLFAIRVVKDTWTHRTPDSDASSRVEAVRGNDNIILGIAEVKGNWGRIQNQTTWISVNPKYSGVKVV